VARTVQKIAGVVFGMVALATGFLTLNFARERVSALGRTHDVPEGE
jgi:hypothetical protein